MSEFEHYDTINRSIEDLIRFLNSISIEAEIKSHLENDYLIACDFYSAYQANPSNLQDHSEGLSAFMGLYELYKWIWAVKDSKEFEKIRPHLNLLIQASPRINSFVPMINPVTNKQDDKTNKFIEAIVGFFAIAYGSDVDLDDPVKSSNGSNPDIIFTFEHQRISIACKTPRSKKSSSIFGNIRSGAKQISESDCDFGYILLNVMNIIEEEHSDIEDNIFTDIKDPTIILRNSIKHIYDNILNEWESELNDLFKTHKKVSPIVITVIHSTTKLIFHPMIVSTSLKQTLATDFRNTETYEENLMIIPKLFNEFIHNRTANNLINLSNLIWIKI